MLTVTLIFQNRCRYEPGKRRVRMTKFSVSPGVYESGSKWHSIVVFNNYMLAAYSLYM